MTPDRDPRVNVEQITQVIHAWLSDGGTVILDGGKSGLSVTIRVVRETVIHRAEEERNA